MNLRAVFHLKFNKDRVYGLDILRAFAILTILYGHGNNILSEWIPEEKLWLFEFDGVSIFFVLSGFLIGKILIRNLEEKKLSFSTLSDFWIRRWFRTLPNYFLILSVLLILHFVSHNAFPQSWWKYLFFAQNFAGEHPSFFGEAWSLSIEEWFYLLAPIGIALLLLFHLNTKRSILLLAIFFILGAFMVRYYRFLNMDIQSLIAWEDVFRKQVVSRLDSLMFGVLGAYFSYYHHALFTKWKKELLYAGLLMLLIYKLSFFAQDQSTEFNVYHCVYSFFLVSIGTLFLLPWLSELKRGKGVWYKIFTFISLISYSLYLTNLSLVQGFLIPFTFGTLSGERSVLLILVKYFTYLIYTVGISFFLYKYFEVPVMNLRDKLGSPQVKKELNKI